MDKTELYQKLCNAFKSRYKGTNGNLNNLFYIFNVLLLSWFILIIVGKEVQQMTNSFWNEVKKKPNWQQIVTEKIQELNAQTFKRDERNSITRFFGASKNPSSPLQQHSSQQSRPSLVASSSDLVELISSPVIDASPSVSSQESVSSKETERERPKQAQIKAKLLYCTSELARLRQIRQFKLAADETLNKIDKFETEHSELKKSLKRLEDNAKHSRVSRNRKKAKLEKAQELLPDLNLSKDKPGSWPLESTQPALLRTIVDIVMSQSAADDKRRCSVLYTCQTLDDLHQALQDRGFSLSRTALYHRLIPKRWISTEGKRHVTTVPVKLMKASANERSKHEDAHFAAATVGYLKELAVVLGSGPVLFLSQDDKCRIPIGLPAANKQSPFLMLMDRKVRLPDHDFVVATRHKLIPSVYAAAKISSTAVTYSGPTYIAIRSGKHDKSDAASHAYDFNQLFNVNEFDEIMKMSSGELKPVVIISVDGGPDENPRYQKLLPSEEFISNNSFFRFPKVQAHAIDHFLSNNLDAIFIITHAPGQSAYNIVERRMAPLSHDLAGLILPHDHFGNHLDKSLKCIDGSLEKRNFSKAGQVLADVWSKTVIDNHPVVATYIEPEASRPIPKEMSETWKSIHLRASKYLLQIVKCDDINCCKPRRSTISNVLPNRFLPAPARFDKNENGVFLASIDNDSAHFGTLSTRSLLSSFIPIDLPFDRFCPSVQDSLHERICNKCNIYHCSEKALEQHRRFGCLAKMLTQERLVIECDVYDEEEDGLELQIEEGQIDGDNDDDIPIFSISMFTTPLFEYC